MALWSTVTLCEDADLLDHEENILSWMQSRGGGSKWRDKAKDVIANRLRHAYRHYTKTYDFDAADVLDLIDDTTPLKDLACYLTIHLFCESATTGDDLFSRKAILYSEKYLAEWEIALGLLSLDLDEDGTIASSEMYNTPDTKLTRGA